MDKIRKWALATIVGTILLGISGPYEAKEKQVLVDKTVQVDSVGGDRNLSTLEEKLMLLGFQKGGTIRIPYLNLDVTLPENHYFKSESLDKYDLSKRVIETNDILDIDHNFKVQPDLALLGYTQKTIINADNIAAFHLVAVGTCVDDITSISTPGHEYGHFLWNTSNQHLIYSRFKDPKLIADSITDSEEFAYLCGWIALMEFSPLNISIMRGWKSSDEMNSMEEKARQLVIDHYVGEK